MSARDFSRLYPKVREVILQEMRGYGNGLGTEGYAGGYLHALADVDAVLRGVPPGDLWRFWRRAEEGA